MCVCVSTGRCITITPVYTEHRSVLQGVLTVDRLHVSVLSHSAGDKRCEFGERFIINASGRVCSWSRDGVGGREGDTGRGIQGGRVTVIGMSTRED